MAEKNGDDNPGNFENSEGSHSGETQEDNNTHTEPLDLNFSNRNHRNIDLFDYDQSLLSHELQTRREENPFSFKKFLNQDSSKGARRKEYSPNLPSPESGSKHSFNSNLSDMNSRLVNTPEMSSVLPDFVQDHLVIEQCYLSGSSSTIDIDSLNLQNLPDLNLEHRDLDFALNLNSNSVSNNLPDFALNTDKSRTFENNCDDLPDFTVNHRDSRKTIQRNETIEASHLNRHRIHISSSPSVPLDLPLYDEHDGIPNASDSSDGPLPFDLPIPAEERNNSSKRNSETVSKSLPDFLSDGPIRQERMEENIPNSRGNLVNSVQIEESNGLPGPEISSPRSEQERLQRDVEMLRRQLAEKNRRIKRLETELEHLHSRDQRETTNLEYALQQVENNLKQTTKRATTAEGAISKLKQENRLLKSEIASLRSENSDLRLGNSSSSSLPPSQEIKNQKIAKELRMAANAAENSLRSLLSGIDNLRVIAASVENMHKFTDRTDEFKDFNYEDSASGPAL